MLEVTICRKQNRPATASFVYCYCLWFSRHLIVGAQGTLSADILTEWVDDGTGTSPMDIELFSTNSSFSELDELAVTVLHTDVDDNEMETGP